MKLMKTYMISIYWQRRPPHHHANYYQYSDHNHDIMMIRSVAGLLIIDVTISSLDINQCDGPRHREGDYLRQSRLWWWWWWLFQLPSNHGCDRITIKVIIVIMVMIMVVVTNQCSCVLPNSQLFSKFCRELYHIQKYLKAQRIGQTTNMQCTFE